MSQLNVDTIKKADGTGNLTVPAETGTVVTTASPSLGRRNLIINGAMQVAQRGTSAIAAGGGRTYITDRFATGRYGSSTAEFTGQQISNSGLSEFPRALKLTVTTADTPSGTEANLLTQGFEGLNIDQLAFGTSNAKQVTVSFWVKSSITGTFGFTINDAGSSMVYATDYTINSADTWERKTITIQGPTSGGNWGSASANIGMYVIWGLGGAGGRLASTADTWYDSSGLTVIGTTNQTNWVGTVGNTFQITGVQLEVGDTATPFEHRSYGEELALCQRYYYKAMDTAVEGPAHGPIGCHYTNNTTRLNWFFPQTMRSAPALTFSGTLNVYSNQQSDSCTEFTLVIADNRCGQLNTTQPTATAGHACFCYADVENAAKIEFDAEL